jgi:Transmembrane secretion effector
MPSAGRADVARLGPPAGWDLLPAKRGGERKSASWHVLKRNRFRVYFAGSLISNLGTWLQNSAQMLLAYQLTHSAFAVGLITCAQFSGFLVVGPWAGTLAGRLGSKNVLVSAQFLSVLLASLGAVPLRALRPPLTQSATPAASPWAPAERRHHGRLQKGVTAVCPCRRSWRPQRMAERRQRPGTSCSPGAARPAAGAAGPAVPVIVALPRTRSPS